MSKKKLTFKIMGATISSLILLAGCGNSQSSSANGSKTTTSGNSSTTSTTSTSSSSSSSNSNKIVDISFWNGHPSGALKKQMHKEVDEFNQSHPNIHVSYVDKYADVQPVTAAFAANKAPNVAMPHQSSAQQFAKSGYLVDLTPYMQTGDVKSSFYPTVWNSDNISNDNKQYLVPYEESAQLVIYYNQDLLKKAGITQAPKTWDDIKNDAEKVTALGSSYHGIAWTPSLNQFFVMVKDFGGSIYSDSSQTKFDLNNSGAQQALSYLRGMVADKSLDITKDYNYQLEFGAGKVAILMDASAGYTYDKGSAGGKFKMVATPAPTGSSGQQYNFVQGDSLAIFNTGTDAQKQASWTFIKWLSSSKVNAEWNQATNYVATGPDSQTQMKDFYDKNPNFAASFSDPTNWLTEPPALATQFESARTNMASDFEKGLRGQESVTAALANMTKVGNEYMSGQKK